MALARDLTHCTAYTLITSLLCPIKYKVACSDARAAVGAHPCVKFIDYLDYASPLERRVVVRVHLMDARLTLHSPFGGPMRTVFSVILAASLALSFAQHDAVACSMVQSGQAQGYRAALRIFVEQSKYTEAEALYAQILALPSTCVRAEDHRLGAAAARSRGDMATAIARYQLGGDQASITQINQLYGSVQIRASGLPTPRVFNWTGIMNWTKEQRTLIDRAKSGFPSGGVYDGYLPPGNYVLAAGYNPNHVEVVFEVKANEKKIVNYP